MSGAIAILGGCGGIGRALVTDAVKIGYEVHVIDLPQSIEAHPLDVPTISADATSELDLARAASELPCGLAGFVNLSGFMSDNQKISETGEDIWEEVLKGNLTSSYNVVRAIHSKLSDGASLVMTGSGLGHFARPGYGPYAVAKAGIAALTRQIALDLAPSIRANCVAPSAVDTAFLRGGTGRSDEKQQMRIDLAAYVDKIPLGRIAEPADITGPILFLLSDASRYITGQVIHVNGGTFMP